MKERLLKSVPLMKGLLQKLLYLEAGTTGWSHEVIARMREESTAVIHSTADGGDLVVIPNTSRKVGDLPALGIRTKKIRGVDWRNMEQLEKQARQLAPSSRHSALRGTSPTGVVAMKRE